MNLILFYIHESYEGIKLRFILQIRIALRFMNLIFLRFMNLTITVCGIYRYHGSTNHDREHSLRDTK